MPNVPSRPSQPSTADAADALRLGEGWTQPKADDASDAHQTQELVRWQDLLGQVGRELAEPLTAALERVSTLTTTGRIDRHGLRALREEIERKACWPSAPARCRRMAWC
jgi:hypothetical protein